VTRRTVRRVVVAFVLLVVAALVAGKLALAPWVRGKIQYALANRYGLDLTVESVSLDVFGGSATLIGIRVRDGDRIVLDAAEARGTIGVRDVLDGRYDFGKLVLVRPVLHIAAEPSGGTDLAKILARPPRKPPRPGPPDVVVFRDLRIEDGRVEFVDALTGPEPPLRLVLDELQVTATELQLSGTPATDSWGDVRADARLPQPDFPGRLSIVGWARQRQRRPTFVAHAALTGLDLRALPQYVSATDRFALGSDVLHLTASFDVRDGEITLGAIAAEVAGTSTVLPMLVGGTTDAPVFDEDSHLATLMRLPLGRIGRVGEVAAGAAWSVLKGGAGAAQDVGGGVVGAGKSIAGGAGGAYEGLSHGDPLGALQAVGGGLFGGAKSLGSGLVEGVKSIFGGGSDAAQALAGVAPADLDAQFTKLHRERRRRMLQAALASVPEGAPARRGRIEHELEAMPKDETPPR
jgi:hypothetical protein